MKAFLINLVVFSISIVASAEPPKIQDTVETGCLTPVILLNQAMRNTNSLGYRKNTNDAVKEFESDKNAAVQSLKETTNVETVKEFEDAIAAAVKRSRFLTRKKKIQDEYVYTKLSKPIKFMDFSDIRYGLIVYVFDSKDPGQGNAYEYLYQIDIAETQIGKFNVKTSLITMTPDWHKGDDDRTVFVCENLK